MQQWWKKSEALEQVVDWSFELAAQYPNERLISLGQSPAWVVQGVGMIRKLRGDEANINFMPFTGSYVEKDPNNLPQSKNEISYTKQTKYFPEKKRLSKYFNFLRDLGLEPDQVFKQTEETGQDAVILDMIKEGNGLASFLSVWLRSPEGNEAVKTLGNKIKVHAFDTRPSLERKTMSFSCKENVKIPLEIRRLSSHEAGLMENISACNIFEPGSDRLVGMYRLASNKPDVGLEHADNSVIVKEVLQTLHSAIQKRHQAEQRQLMRLDMVA